MITVLFCFIFGIYALLIFSLLIGFKLLPTTRHQNIEASTIFTVIIPFRNEAKNLPILIDSITSLDYPTSKVDFLFVDDASEDNSVQVIEKFAKKHPSVRIKILSNQRKSNSPKKDAILTAVSHTESEWIVTTDADCILPKKWLLLLNQKVVQKQPKMIAAPVTYQSNSTLFHYFQLLDFLSLQATTIGTFGLRIPFMCNGANLAYQREAFMEVQGFVGNDTIASGDDVFLLEKFIKHWPNKVVYVKATQATVQTFPVETIQQLIAQRIRWASKSTHYHLPTGKIIGSIVMLMNCICCLIPFLLFTPYLWKFASILFISKIVIDSIFLHQILRFHQQKFNPFLLFLCGIIHPFFTVTIVILSLFSSYSWKERVFKK